MRHAVIIIATIAIMLTIMAFTHSNDQAIGAIGDVKYSVLPPDKFKEENGNGWALMDDKIPLQGSDLNTKHGITSLPDARGLFIRSLNLNRNDEKGDPYAKENKRARSVGEYQGDAVGKHTHPIDMKTGYMLNLGAFQNPPPVSIFVGDRPAYNNSYGGLTATDASLPIIETRPKNIALYTYIKIND
ncbi:hypothetical protein FHW88_005193 [Mucilaginibacter sp. SG538B]|uniref:hypothetical protein n=1 Tax=Mucilaginibacter sp. SG538B TaxID=2587021 RepID=UPI00159DC8BB|nr:hypothetical protein [Mucilaginibacter sp. SG538B]NVM66875.1 hypothetical protein [Mucilaginibacter sp. SG538B]